MNNIVKIVALMVTIMMYSCSKEDDSLITPNQSFGDEKSIDYIKDLEIQTNTRIFFNSELNIWQVFFGKRELKVRVINAKRCVLSGDFLAGKSVGLQFTNESGLEFFNKDFTQLVSTSTYLGIVAEGDEYLDFVAPCDEHPADQKFSDCVVLEIDEFCDGLVGCAAIMIMPVPILAVIAGHCAACTTQ